MNQYIIFMKNQLYTLYINIQHLKQSNLTEAMVLRLILMNHIHHTGSTFGVGIDNKIVRNVNENLFSYLVSSGL